MYTLKKSISIKKKEIFAQNLEWKSKNAGFKKVDFQKKNLVEQHKAFLYSFCEGGVWWLLKLLKR